MTMNADEKTGAVVTALVVGGAVLVAFIYSSDADAQFREQEAWKFKTPYEKSMDLAIHQNRLLMKGGYFRGEHTARYYNVDMDVQHMDAEGFQEITNIGNYTTTSIEGDGNTLNVEGIQRSEEQSGLNGMASRNSTVEGTLNVEVGQ